MSPTPHCASAVHRAPLCRLPAAEQLATAVSKLHFSPAAHPHCGSTPHAAPAGVVQLAPLPDPELTPELDPDPELTPDPDPDPELTPDPDPELTPDPDPELTPDPDPDPPSGERSVIPNTDAHPTINAPVSPTTQSNPVFIRTST